MGKKIFEETGGPHRGHAAGASDVEKQASQLASDTKYKVKQSLGKGTKLNPAQVAKAYLSQLAKSPAPPTVKALAKKKIIGEEYTQDIPENVEKLVKKTVIGALHTVFVEGVEEKKEWIVVTDKKTGNTYRRQADRAKIAELRANPNISRVEVTAYHPDEDDDKQGAKTASVKSGKGLGNDGNLANNYPPYNKVTRGDVIAGATGKDQMGGKKKVRKEEFLGEVAKEKNDRKVTGDGVDNKKIIKVFPQDPSAVRENYNEEVNTTTPDQTQKPLKKDTVDPTEKRQISTLQQFQRKEQQLNQQKLAAQKANKIPVGSVQMNSHQPEGDDIQEVAPPGFEGTVRRMKDKKEIDNPYALAWWMKGKGYKSHRKPSGEMKEESCGSDDKPKLKKSEGGVEDPREVPTNDNLVRNKLRAMGLKMSYEPEGEMVGEAQAIGKARSTDINPRGAAVRASSGRGMTMTPARGLGASKPSGDDAKRAARQAAQAKADRIAAAKDRAASGEDRLGKLIRSVQKNSFQLEGDKIEEIYGGRYGHRQTASGRWRERDEPDEAEQLRQSDAIQAQMAARRKAAAKAKLAAAGKLPVKKKTEG